MVSLSATTLARAEAWYQQDPNIHSAGYVQNLLRQAKTEKNNNNGAAATAAAIQELHELFPDDESKRISFGTAGLRAAMKPGPLGMNDLVVVQTAQGLAKYCLQVHSNQGDSSNDDTNPPLCAVIGYDHRASKPELQLSSLSFAILTALVFAQAGMECVLLDGVVATPLVPFTMTQISNAVVGIMVTASHNPKQDAGYKVYWSDACQIRSPLDTEISNSILQHLTPWTDYRALLQQRQAQYGNTDPCLGLSSPAQTQTFIQQYFTVMKNSGLCTNQARKLLLPPSDTTTTTTTWNPPTFLYTAMHGVGYKFTKQSFVNFGLPAFVSVPTQEQPDPSFPTVVFPNPEEKGALDTAKNFAATQFPSPDTPIVLLANDPDADRLAVAERSSSSTSSEDGSTTKFTWQVFHGDQIGVMLGHWLWSQLKDSTTDTRPISMCASTVSSQMLRTIATVEGFHFEDTLTGFKWIGSNSARLNASGYRNIFCYEEAIGFCCGNVIFDKDGITAAAVMAELALHVYHKGLTLGQHMQSLYDKYGEFVSNNGYFFLKDMSIVPAVMDHMTNQGKFDRKTVGEYEIESVRYLGEPGYDSRAPDGKPTLPTSASSPMITLRFKNGCVAQFRGSGTEPKFKYYIELRGHPGVARSTVEQELSKISQVLMDELVQPERFGLEKV
jgi:phosphoglucomutase/phosphoglucomutase/phosphopentomutase